MSMADAHTPSEWAITLSNTARHVQPHYTRAGRALSLLAATVDSIDPGDQDMPPDETIHYRSITGTIEVAEMLQISLTNPEARNRAGVSSNSNYRFGINASQRTLVAIPRTKKLGDREAFQVDLSRSALDRASKQERAKLRLIATELSRALELWWLPPKQSQGTTRPLAAS